MKNNIFLPLLSFLILIAGLFAVPSAMAQPNRPAGPRWDKLGEKLVDFGKDHDVMVVTITEGRFNAVKFRVQRAPIHLTNIRVNFANGDSENFVLDSKIAPGSESRILDLPGNQRIIRDIVFNYHTVPNARKRATVEAWGRR